MTSVGDWQRTLDEFEARLDAQEAALAKGDCPVISPFVPGVVAPPLPAALTQRATALVWRCRAIEDALAVALHVADQRLQRLHHEPARKAHTGPMYLDSRV